MSVGRPPLNLEEKQMPEDRHGFRRAAKAGVQIAFLRGLGIEPSPALQRAMIEPVPSRDRRGRGPSQTPDEVAVEAVRRHAYLAPYLTPRETDSRG